MILIGCNRKDNNDTASIINSKDLLLIQNKKNRNKSRNKHSSKRIKTTKRSNF
jgi:hypothetical protein